MNEHKFCHTFRDTVDPFYLCNTEIKTANHYLLRCQLLTEQRTKFFEYLQNRNDTIFSHCDEFKDFLNIPFL